MRANNSNINISVHIIINVNISWYHLVFADIDISNVFYYFIHVTSESDLLTVHELDFHCALARRRG